MVNNTLLERYSSRRARDPTVTPEKIGKLQEVLDVRFEVPKHSNLLKLRSVGVNAINNKSSSNNTTSSTPNQNPLETGDKVREIFLGLVGPSKTPRSCGLLPVSMVAPMSERWIMNFLKRTKLI